MGIACAVLTLPLHATFAACHKQRSSPGGEESVAEETIRTLHSQLGLKEGAHTHDDDDGLGGDQECTKLCRTIQSLHMATMATTCTGAQRSCHPEHNSTEWSVT